MSKVEGQPRAAVIGLGLMGSALADALIAKGFDVTVWNRSPERSERFAKEGIEVAATVADAVIASDVTVVCVLDHDSTKSTVMTADVASALKGKTLVQLTTMTSAQARELGQWAGKSSLNYLEGQILNYPDDIRGGRGIIVCSGRASVYSTCRPVLEGMAGYAPHISETIGAAAVLDKALFQIAYPAFVGFLHGAAMCRALDIPIGTYADIVQAAYFSGRLIEDDIRGMASRITTGNYDKDTQSDAGRLWRGVRHDASRERSDGHGNGTHRRC